MPEKLECWRRNPVDVVKELISRPEFAKTMRFAPERVYGDQACQKRVIGEMWTADWWWETQVCPVILPYPSLPRAKL